MFIEINIDYLSTIGLNPTEFCYLYALFEKNFSAGEKIAILKGKVQLDPAQLEADGWIKIQGPTIQEVELREKSIKLFADSRKLNWMEFCNSFPFKTPRGRVLRTSDPLAKSNEKAQKLYLLATKNGRADLHHDVMKGLNAELEARKKNNGLEYINNIETWLRNRNWEKYTGIDSSDLSAESRVKAV